MFDDWRTTLQELLESTRLDEEFYGQPVGRWLAAAVILLVALLVLPIIKSIVRRRAAALAEKRDSDLARGLASLVEATKWWFLLIASVYFGTLVLEFPDASKTRNLIHSVIIVVFFLQAGIWGNVFLTFGIQRYVKKRLETDAAAVTTMSALGFVGKLVLWSIVTLLILDNLGQDVTALVAGLGVGGVAVALAAQNILGDLFASMSIVLDKPFVLGDFIIVGSDMGTVEHVGLKTTRVRSLSGEQLVFSNTDLLQSRIRNYKRMYERRIVFQIGVTYETPHEKLLAIPRIIRQTVESQEQARFDRSHFSSFGDSALIFETVYYVTVPDYNVYMDIQQTINLTLYKTFEEEGIEFAYPTHMLYVKKEEPVGV